jgi:paired amphipathic helix protein Sin3a
VSGQLAVELLNTESGKSEDAFDGEGWAETRDKDDVGDKEQLPLRPVFLARNIRSRRRQQQQAVHQTKDADTAGGDAEKKDDKSAVAAALPVGDGAECKFDVNSFKMVYVVNNENYLYKGAVFTKQLTTILFLRFS